MRSNPRAALSALAGIALVATSVLVGGSPATASGGHHHHHHHFRPAAVGFASPTYEQQAGEPVTVTIVASRALARSSSVRVTSYPGTARPDIDYVPVDARVTIPAGAMSATLTIATILPDTGVSPATFTLRLSRPSAALHISPTARATTVSIVRDDLPPLGGD